MKPSRQLIVAGLSGVVFAVGLGVSGMTRPAKVLGFLDVSGGHWDPTLMLVMAGAIAVHMPVALWFRRRATPAPSGPPDEGMAESRERQEEDGPGFAPRRGMAGVNARLVVGATIFGVGWGLSGYCPGPALVTLASFSPGILVFVASMMSGMWLYHLLSGRVAPPPLTGKPASVTALPWVERGKP